MTSICVDFLELFVELNIISVFFHTVTFALKRESTHLQFSIFINKKTGQFKIKKIIIRQIHGNSYFQFAERVIYHYGGFHLDPVMDLIHLPPQ